MRIIYIYIRQHSPNPAAKKISSRHIETEHLRILTPPYLILPPHTASNPRDPLHTTAWTSSTSTTYTTYDHTTSSTEHRQTRRTRITDFTTRQTRQIDRPFESSTSQDEEAGNF